MKMSLLNQGVKLMELFCNANCISIPPVNVVPRADWPFSNHCAYYRPVKIEICVDRCANIGTAGRQWSYPGYSVDRTPYGVIQHELGHHVDVTLGGGRRGYTSDFSRTLRAQVNEAALTGYCPNDGEWFAEHFRLFVTNPSLLSAIRPRTFAAISHYLMPVIPLSWEQVLQDAPPRTLDVCRRKIESRK